jgi:hypothetical protein
VCEIFFLFYRSSDNHLCQSSVGAIQHASELRSVDGGHDMRTPYCGVHVSFVDNSSLRWIVWPLVDEDDMEIR